MTLDEARDLIRAGAPYGAVCERLPEPEWDALAAWYVAEPGVPDLAARKRIERARPRPEATLEGCPKCGGLMVRTGTCLTCQACGESSGGCG